jgi:hypothetical protein
LVFYFAIIFARRMARSLFGFSLSSYHNRHTRATFGIFSAVWRDVKAPHPA